MLINLSNHPSHLWSEAQKQAAISQYHEIVDLPFPQIAPDADIDSVLELAQTYVHKCLELMHYTDVYTFDFQKNMVHVMGEMTFTYNVVRYLGHKAIRAIASTTERIAETDATGQKTSVFRFKQFRGYSSENELPF